MKISLNSIGKVKSTRKKPLDDNWYNETCSIVIADNYPTEMLTGIDSFSHLEIIYHFHLADDAFKTIARHPRDNKEWPAVGIFAQRTKNRPNKLGVTKVELISVEGNILHVKGLDAIDGTPVLDIKPVIKAFEIQGEIKEPNWCAELMKNYW